MKVTIEDEEESITNSENVTADEFSHASSSQRENSNAIFTSEKLEKSDELVNAINKSTVNDAVYELNTATTSDTQGNLMRDPYTVTQTSNRIPDQNY